MLTLEQMRVEQGEFSLSADLSLAPDARVAVIGASGSGKSTLLGAVAGVVPLTSGRIVWKGSDITDAAPADRPVSILFQDGNLFAHLSVEKTLALTLDPKGRVDRQGAARIAQALDRVGLEGLGPRKPGRLSGGQQARAALARVVLQARPVMLLDEAFGGLGPALKSDMLKLVREIAEEIGSLVLMVSHEPEDALALADQALWIADGRLNGPVDTETLLSEPPAALRGYFS